MDFGPCDGWICLGRRSHSHWITNLSIELENIRSELFKKQKIVKIGSETAENEPIGIHKKKGNNHFFKNTIFRGAPNHKQRAVD